MKNIRYMTPSGNSLMASGPNHLPDICVISEWSYRYALESIEDAKRSIEDAKQVKISMSYKCKSKQGAVKHVMNEILRA